VIGRKRFRWPERTKSRRTQPSDFWLCYSFLDGSQACLCSDSIESLLMEAAGLKQFQPDCTLLYICLGHPTEPHWVIVMEQTELVAEAAARQRQILRWRAEVREKLDEPFFAERWINPMTIIVTAITISVAVILAVAPILK
jgi:hypothetical protein